MWGKSKIGDGGNGDIAGRGFAEFALLAEPECDIFPYGERVKQRAKLKCHAKPAAQIFHRGAATTQNFNTINFYTAAIWRDQAV